MKVSKFITQFTQAGGQGVDRPGEVTTSVLGTPGHSRACGGFCLHFLYLKKKHDAFYTAIKKSETNAYYSAGFVAAYDASFEKMLRENGILTPGGRPGPQMMG